jgi:hypothetical protein
MKKFLGLFFFLLIAFPAYSQLYPPPTIIQKRFNDIKRIVQPDIIQLPDSIITFPIIGLTNILTVPGNSLSGPYTEIELWIIDAKGEIIYNTIMATQNMGYSPLEIEYCRYMKLQSNYLLRQRHIASHHP